MWYWPKARNNNKWNRFESQEIKLYIYGQLSFDIDAKSFQWRKNNPVNKWYWGQMDIYRLKSDVEPLPNTMYKNELKMLRNLKVGAKIIKFLKQNRDVKSSDFRLNNSFLDSFSKALH